MYTTEDQPVSGNPEKIRGSLPPSFESTQCIGAANNGSSANTVIKKNLTVKYKLKKSDYFKRQTSFVKQGRALVNMVIVGIFKMKNEGFNYIDFDKDVDEWYPCEETEQSTQEVVLNFPVDQIT